MTPADRPTVVACSTAKDERGEQPTKLPITTKVDGEPRVAIGLGPGTPAYSSMPRLAAGDRIKVSAEVEVTTDAADTQDAVATPYGYSPKVEARLLLAADGRETDAKRALELASKSETCQHRQHHHRVVFDVPPYTLKARDLDGRGGSHLNLVLSAHSSGARTGQVLLIGQNEPPQGGRPASVKGDMSKLNIVRYRGEPEPAGRLVSATSVRNSHLPVVKGQAKVVYSLRLVNLEKDEQLLLEAKLNVNNSHSYPVRVAIQVILTDTPKGIDLHGDARDLGSFDGEIGKYNGTNAMPRKACAQKKFGTLRMLKRARMPLFVNLVARCGDPERRAETTDTIKVEPGGSLNIRRFPASVLG